MSLSKKQQSFHKNNLAGDILEACAVNGNVVKFKVASSSFPQRQVITDPKELHEIALKRKALWEIAQKGIELQTSKSGQQVMCDPLAAIEAISELNKLDGHYAPQQFEYTVNFVDGGSRE